jgi:4-hydroxy-3-polyprenylbenzoate decarboxylase
VLRHELDVDAGPDGRELAAALEGWLGAEVAERVAAYPPSAIEAPPSSGTHLTGGCVICPCSMGTLARVSSGYSSNLVERAADVALKEGRRLVVVPREAPLSVIHLENLLRVARLGARVLPAMPGFYHRPQRMEDLVEHVTAKILDSLGVDDPAAKRWKGTEPDPEAGTESPAAEG